MFVPKLIVCFQEGYDWKRFRSDAAAGVMVGLVALPLAMAFAIASGLPPERGLYTAVVAGFLISALGGSRVQIGGPTGAFVIIVGRIAAQHGYQGLAVATIMAGVILVIMGLSGMGTLVKYIPYPVTTGFTSGIALVILSSQMKDFFGLPIEQLPHDFVATWIALTGAFLKLNAWSALLGVLTIGGIVLWPKRWNKIPGPIVALVAVTLAASVFELPVDTLGSRFGGIPNHLPAPQLPAWDWLQIKSLVPVATTIAVLAAIESLLSAVVADGMIGGRHKSNMELVGQGIANIASPLFGGIPATGAIARTATNVRNGGRTPVAGIVHVLTLLVILLTAGPFAAQIPLAALAGILVIVSYHMFEWRSFRFLLTGPKSDIAVLLTTFFLTVFVNLTVAVQVGMILAAFLFMRNMAELTQVTLIGRDNADPEHLRDLVIPKGVQVFSVQGSFFFGAAHKLMEISRTIEQAPRALILDMTGVLHMDASGLHVLEKIGRECAHRGTRFMIAGIHAQPLIVAKKTHLLRRLGPHNLYPSLPEALRHAAPSGS